jgi:DNA helicase-2/ATP-dependent DNA helicase PcrA
VIPAGPPPSAPVITPTLPRTRAPRFRAGDRVRHAKFGEGIVVKSTLTRDDEEVEVAFPGVGLKRLSTAFAPLERLT